MRIRLHLSSILMYCYVTAIYVGVAGRITLNFKNDDQVGVLCNHQAVHYCNTMFATTA